MWKTDWFAALITLAMVVIVAGVLLEAFLWSRRKLRRGRKVA